MKKFLLTALVAVAMALPARAGAATIQFDPDGLGILPFRNILGLDWAPGNGIAVGANANTLTNTGFTFFYQANLAITLGPGTYANDNGAAGTLDSFTLVLGFGETVISNVTAAGVTTLTFGFDGTNPVNFFQIYAHTAPADDLNGTGFVSGTLIMDGTILPAGYLSGFSTSGIPGGALDQAGVDSYLVANGAPPGTVSANTITGSGHTDLTVRIHSASPTYFKALVPGDLFLFSATSGNATIPYDTADPSACFFANSNVGLNPTTCTGTFGQMREGVESVGAVNGLGANTMLQVDASSSFTTGPAATVPEPATMTLFGLGLLGTAAARRRQARKNKQ